MTESNLGQPAPRDAHPPRSKHRKDFTSQPASLPANQQGSTTSGEITPPLRSVIEPPPLIIYQDALRAIEGYIPRISEDDSIVSEAILAGEPDAQDLFGNLGEKPFEKVSQERIRQFLREMQAGTEIEIIFGPGARDLISKLPSASSIPESVLTIYGADRTTQDNTTKNSWYVDLLHRPEGVSSSGQINDAPLKIKLVKTNNVATTDLIKLVRESLLKKGKSIAPAELAGAVGDFMHLIARNEWSRDFGFDPDYDIDYDLQEGGNPDVLDRKTKRIGEYGSPNQAMRKLIITAMYALKAKLEFRVDFDATVYLYDANPEFWRNYASAWRKQK